MHGVAYSVNCVISSGENKQEINVEAQYSNITSLKTEENYKIKINMENGEEKLAYQYNFETAKDFDQIIKLDAIKESDVFILNNVGKDYIDTLMAALQNVYAEVNRSQMQELGLEENENPLIYTTPMGYYIYKTKEIINNTNTQVTDQAVASFNASYEMYMGNQKGSTIKTLVQSVIASNSARPDHIVSINGQTEQTQLQEYANRIDDTKQYNVAIEKDASGYVNTIRVIE